MTRTPARRLHVVVLAVWILGFLIGAASHIADLIAGGTAVYEQFHAGLRLFWISLTLLDPLTAALLALRRRAGIVLALVVILTDIAVNWTVYFTVSGSPLSGVVNQTLFAAILLVTAPMLWRRSSNLAMEARNNDGHRLQRPCRLRGRLRGGSESARRSAVRGRRRELAARLDVRHPDENRPRSTPSSTRE